MTAPVQNILSTPEFKFPNPPDKVGEDGHLYRCYDALAQEIDDDMTKGLKEQLEAMFVFAGLFAGVNTAFLALTLPLLSPDITEDTNALLVQNHALLTQLILRTNDTTSMDPTLPSTDFHPSLNIRVVNALFALSLTFAILSSFLAVVGRQWLVYHRERTGGGPDRQ